MNRYCLCDRATLTFKKQWQIPQIRFQITISQIVYYNVHKFFNYPPSKMFKTGAGLFLGPAKSMRPGFEHNEYLISYFPDSNWVSLDLFQRKIKRRRDFKTIPNDETFRIPERLLFSFRVRNWNFYLGYSNFGRNAKK